MDALNGQVQLYQDVLLRSIRVAQHLQSKGITFDSTVVLCTYNTMDSCLPFLACLFLGVKVAPLDPSLSSEDSAHLLNIVKPSFLFCDIECLETMEEALEKVNLSTQIIIMGGEGTYISFSEFLIETGTEASFEAVPVKDLFDTGVINFSSGTTGKPKGVCLTHYGLIPKHIRLVKQNFK